MRELKRDVGVESSLRKGSQQPAVLRRSRCASRRGRERSRRESSPRPRILAVAPRARPARTPRCSRPPRSGARPSACRSASRPAHERAVGRGQGLPRSQRPIEERAHARASSSTPIGDDCNGGKGGRVKIPWVLIAAILGSAMTFIDSTAVNVSLPVIQRELHATTGQTQWVIEGYALFLSALILLGGALGDLYGRRLSSLSASCSSPRPRSPARSPAASRC